MTLLCILQNVLVAPERHEDGLRSACIESRITLQSKIWGSCLNEKRRFFEGNLTVFQYDQMGQALFVFEGQSEGRFQSSLTVNVGIAIFPISFEIAG